MKNIQKMIMWMLLAASLMISGCASSSSGMFISDKEVPRVISSDSGINYTPEEIDDCLEKNDFKSIDEENPFALYKRTYNGQTIGYRIREYSRDNECMAAYLSLEEGVSMILIHVFSAEKVPEVVGDFPEGSVKIFIAEFERQPSPANARLLLELYKYVGNSG